MGRRKPTQLAWGIRKEGRTLWTRNAVKGISVRDERRKKDSRIEWRQWEPLSLIHISEPTRPY